MFFSHDTPGAGPRMDPRCTVGRIYKEDHYTLLHTKYESFSHDAPGAGPVWTPWARLAGFIKRNNIYCYKQNMKALGLVVSEKIFFLCFTHDPPPPRGGGARMDPRGTVGRIYKEEHYTLLHTKYESSGSCGFGEEYFFMFSNWS